jgi:outer membrane receptor protein involved in Fe transport
MIRPVGLLVSVSLAVLLLADARAAAGQATTLSGVVIDMSGASVAGATVTAQTADGRKLTATSAADGTFTIEAASARLRVTAAGFAPEELEATGGDSAIQILLRPASFADTVVVTATRGAERLQSAESATVLSSAALNNSAAGAMDDVLRATPGFSLFRRSSSRVANPTTQGVTLRGVSGSGASRTLVLADGVPLNDPFGSWVYWNRIPQAAVERVEVLRGATGDLYGADALGGVVQLLTLSPSQTRARATIDGGSHDTFRGSLFGGYERNGWAANGAFEGTRTDGAYVVAEEARRSIDTKADSDYQTGTATVGRSGSGWHAWVKGAKYAEDRGNGTPAQVNTTDWQQAALDLGGEVAGGFWQLNGVGSSQDYYQTFTAVAADRASERLTTKQTTDTTYRMFGGQWSKPIGRVGFIVGGDYHRTRSTVSELRYSVTNVETGPFLSGGTEHSTALFARASVQASDRLTIGAGGRVDWWNSDPQNHGTELPEKDVTFFSPRLSVAWRQSDTWSVQGATYHASRTPTLNELHRGFRAGNAVTNPNPLLEPETITGVEGGVLLTRGSVSARATGFYNQLEGAISNVTLSSTPALIVRERRNSDEIEATGLELEVDARLPHALSLTGQIVFTSAHYRGSVATPSIEDNRVSQVPAVQGGFGATWADPRWFTVAAQVRYSGEQYDDDLNTFVLNPYGVLDLQVSRAVAQGFTGFLAIENLFDQDYDTGRTPIRTVGWPLTVRVGVRIAVP